MAYDAGPQRNERLRLRPFGQQLRSDRGSISPFILLLLPALAGLAGLAYDGGILFAARRDAANVAAAAARAGANDLYEPSIYAGDPELAPSAPSTAQAFAFSQGVSSASARSLDRDLIEVTVTQSVDMVFLRVVGIGTQTVSGSAQSRIREGVTG